MTRKLLLILVVVLLGLTAVTVVLSRGEGPAGGTETSRADTSPVPIGGGFSLTDQNGKVVKDTDFRGKLMLVFFGFTHCPDICPTTMSAMTAMMNALGDQSAGVVPMLITVDPERDTPARMKEFLADFHPAIIGLTGSKEEVQAVAQAYKVYHERPSAEAQESGNYMVNHTGFVYLMGRDGQYVSHFSQDDFGDKMTQSVKRALKR